jgi:hypothetical protein
VSLVDLRGALRRVADVLVCQRQAVPDIAAADRLIEHCRSSGMRLVYDLDDDPVEASDTHPERLPHLGPVAVRMLVAADAVWVSTQGLQRRIAGLRPEVRVVPSQLDERIWGKALGEAWGASDTDGPVRILFMAMASRDSGLEFVEPVALRLRHEFGDDISFEVVGVTAPADLGPALHLVRPPPSAAMSYPGFVEWLTRERRWHIGVAPLMGSDSARSQVATRLFDYAALGLAVVASDVAAHRDDALGKADGVRLIPNDEHAWCAALAELVRDARERRRRGEQARAALLKAHTLAAHAEERWRALADAVATAPRVAGVPMLALREAEAASHELGGV